MSISLSNVNGSTIDAYSQVSSPSSVYLSPAQNLANGNYYYQVTDFSGKHLLSPDHISCRRFSVYSGQITKILSGYNYGKNGSFIVPLGQCQHSSYSNHFPYPVQLAPFNQAPDQSSLYKVWIIQDSDYIWTQAYPDSITYDPTTFGSSIQPTWIVNGQDDSLPGLYHGFLADDSLNALFQIPVPPDVPYCEVNRVVVKSYHDINGNGVEDDGDTYIDGWVGTYVREFVGGPLSVNNGMTFYPTTSTVVVGEVTGTSYVLTGVTVVEYSGRNISYGNDPVELTFDLTSAGPCAGQTTTVVLLNVGVAQVRVCNIYDADGDDGFDPNSDSGMGGWVFNLNENSELLDTCTSQSTGCCTFKNVFPGNYTLEEDTPIQSEWISNGPLFVHLLVTSVFMEVDGVGTVTGSYMTDTGKTKYFFNHCQTEITPTFQPTTFWSSPEGQSQITQNDTLYIHTLDPFQNTTIPLTLMENPETIKGKLFQQFLTFILNIRYFFNDMGDKGELWVCGDEVWWSLSEGIQNVSDILRKNSSEDSVFIVVEQELVAWNTNGCGIRYRVVPGDPAGCPVPIFVSRSNQKGWISGLKILGLIVGCGLEVFFLVILGWALVKIFGNTNGLPYLKSS